MQRMTVDLPDDIHEWVRCEAFAQHTTKKAVIVSALDAARKRADDAARKRAERTAKV